MPDFFPHPPQEDPPTEELFETHFADVEKQDFCNTSKRCPTLLILDVSNSMEVSGGLKQLNDGLKIFKDQTSGDVAASQRIEVMVVSFSGEVVVMDRFRGIKEWDPPELKSRRTGTNIGGAILKAFDLLESRLRNLESHGIPTCRPLMLLITDGVPTPRYAKFTDPAREKIKEAERKGELWFYSVGVDGADHDLLRSLSREGTSYLPDVDFVELFNFLSTRLTTYSRGSMSSDENPLRMSNKSNHKSRRFR